MRLKMRHKSVLNQLWLVLGVSLTTTVSYAANFYTIIGPDGHPIIVQNPIKSKKRAEDKPREAHKSSVQNTEQVAQKVEEKKVVAKAIAPNLNPSENKKDVSVTGIKAHDQQIQNSQKEIKKTDQKNDQTRVLHLPNSEMKLPIPDVKSATKDRLLDTNKDSNVSIDSINVTPTGIKKDEQEKVEQDNSNFAVIDGEKYVNNEYLEDKEFNLDGKKRFYMTPESGGAGHNRFETIERQKGLSLSLMDRMLNKEPSEKKPIALSSTYYRLPKSEVIQNLEQACFSGKKILKAKDLSVKNQEVGVWPVAPIKERFAYEVIKLDKNVQNVLLTSYASSSKLPTYYWPLVVFLDDKGCVLEGVSGFKNEESVDNNFEYAAMEGMLRKPNEAVFMFLTPLSSAVDVENKQLTNHGQIKLSVIQ